MALLSFECRHRYPSGFRLEVAFELRDRFSALFGPSGSGKSSILHLIAGFLRPQQGMIRLGDRILMDTAQGICLPPERRHIGIVYQEALLFPHLTVEGNLRYGRRRARRRGPTLDWDRVVEVLEIGSLLRRWPGTLSGGERQRVALGRALLSGPELLLMDEPLASLDAALKDRILTYLERAVAEWDIPTLFVTHAQVEVRRAAAGVILLDQGRVLDSGPVEEVLIRPEPLGWGNSTGPINLLRLESVEPRAESLTARIGLQPLLLPPWSDTARLPSFVQFSPTDVILSRQEVAGLSVRNHLRGRVCRSIAMNQAVFVAVDVGQVLWAEVTPQAVAELDLQPGVDVTCLVKTHSLVPIV